MTWPHEDRAALDAFYGRHELGPLGTPTEAWIKKHLTVITTPYPLTLSWEPHSSITRVQCHRLVADSLHRIFAAILAHYGSIQSIHSARMHLYGGAYNYRKIAGASSLSLHAYGAAIDLDPDHNPLGKAWKADSGMMPMEVVAIFEGEGWKWGGRFKGRKDCMHFQAAT